MDYRKELLEIINHSNDVDIKKMASILMIHIVSIEAKKEQRLFFIRYWKQMVGAFVAITAVAWLFFPSLREMIGG